MVACSKQRKTQCVEPCEWKKNVGCRKQAIQLSKAKPCYQLRKSGCVAPCQWVKGKGCKNDVLNQVDKMPCEISKCPDGKVLTPDESKCTELEYVGEGSYGCVMVPPISEKVFILHEYIPYTNRNNRDIGKIYIKGERDFKEELQILKVINKIDPNSEFTTKLKGAFKITGKCLHYNKSILECLNKKIKQMHLRPFYEIILSNGGVKLSSKTPYTIPFHKFLQYFNKLLNGMLKLQHHGIVHRDIKPGNMLINDKQLSLIDFGLSCPVDDVYYPSSQALNILSYKNYRFYPPEFFVAYVMLLHRHSYEGNKIKFDRFMNSLYNRINKMNFFQQNHLISNLDLMQEYKQGVSNLINRIKSMNVTFCKDIFTRDIAFKADVFSLTYILLELNHHIQYNSNSEKLFVEYIYKKCRKADPYERLTLMELYKIVNNELTKYEKTITNTGGSQYLSRKSQRQTIINATIDKDKYVLDYDDISPRKSLKKKIEIKSKNNLHS